MTYITNQAGETQDSGAGVVTWSWGWGMGWLFLFDPPAWQPCTLKRATMVNAGSFVRRPLKWGEKTEKTTDRLPSTLDLECLERCGGFHVCMGRGLLAAQPTLLAVGWKGGCRILDRRCWKGMVPGAVMWALCLVGCRCFFLRRGWRCLFCPQQILFLLSLSELTLELATPISKKKSTRMPSISTTSLWQSTEPQMCSRNANRWVGNTGCFAIFGFIYCSHYYLMTNLLSLVIVYDAAPVT